MSDADKIISNLEHLSGNIADRVEKALIKGMKQIQGDAKLLVPVKEGRLRNSTTASVTRDAELDIIGEVGTNLEYAAYVEFGTGQRGESADKDLPEGLSLSYTQREWPGQAPQPFLYPAFKNNKKEIEQKIAAAIKAAMREGRT